MASRDRSISRSAINLLVKTTATTSTAGPTPKSIPCLGTPLSSPTLPRQTSNTSHYSFQFFIPKKFHFLSLGLNLGSVSQLGSLQSLLPLHMAVYSARLTSFLGFDSKCSRDIVVSGYAQQCKPGV